MANHINGEFCVSTRQNPTIVDVDILDITASDLKDLREYYTESIDDHCLFCEFKYLMIYTNKMLDKTIISADNIKKLICLYNTIKNCLYQFTTSHIIDFGIIPEISPIMIKISDEIKGGCDGALHGILTDIKFKLSKWTNVVERSHPIMTLGPYKDDEFAHCQEPNTVRFLGDEVWFYEYSMENLVQHYFTEESSEQPNIIFPSDHPTSRIHHTLLESSDGLNLNSLEKYTEAIDMFVQLFSRVDKQNEKKVLDCTFDASTDLFEPTDIGHIYYISRQVLQIILKTFYNEAFKHNFNEDLMFAIHKGMSSICNVLHGLCYKEIFNIRMDELMKINVILDDILFTNMYSADYYYLKWNTELENIRKISLKLLELSLPSNSSSLPFSSEMDRFFTSSQYYMQEEFTEEETDLGDPSEELETQEERNYIKNTKKMTACLKKKWKTVLYSVESPEEFRTKFNDGICSICIDELKQDFSLLICQHTFCTVCMVKWIQSQPMLVSSVSISSTKCLFDIK